MTRRAFQTVEREPQAPTDTELLSGVADGDVRAFYGALAGALRASVERSLGEAVGSLTHDALRRQLRARGMEEELVRRLVDELDGCDFARFSSAGGTPEEMQQALGRGEALLDRLGRFRALEVHA